MRPAPTAWPRSPRASNGARIIVNLQGDEPEISGAALDLVVALLEDDPEAPMATLATPIRDESIYRDPACVKVVCYRARPGPLLLAQPDPLPSRRPARARHGRAPGRLSCTSASTPIAATSCSSSASLPPSPLEAAEKLEQLRVLEAGYPIAVGIVDEPSVGIDTPEDYRRFVERWRAGADDRDACRLEGRRAPGTRRPSPLEFGPGRDVK